MQAYIKSISYYLPPNILDNKNLSKQFPLWTPSDIFAKTGVLQRHCVTEGITASDLAVECANRLFEEHDLAKSDIDFLLFCAQEFDFIGPTTACTLQHRLDLPSHIGALDYNLGCSGFVYGLSIAKGLISAKVAQNVLLINSSVLTKYLHPKDINTRILFGDGATATLISVVPDKKRSSKIGEFVLGTDGKGYESLIIKNGGARFPKKPISSIAYKDKFGNLKSDEHLYMNGVRVFTFSLKRVPRMIAELLEKSSKTIADIDLFVFHQANAYLLEVLRKKIGIPEEKFFNYMANCGNTVSASIPIALYEAIRQGRVQQGSTVLLAAFGVGLSWAGTIIVL